MKRHCCQIASLNLDANQMKRHDKKRHDRSFPFSIVVVVVIVVGAGAAYIPSLMVEMNPANRGFVPGIQ